MHSCATVYNSHLSHLNQSSLYLAREKQNKFLDKQKQESSQKLYEQMRFILRYSHNFQVVCRQTRWIRTIANAGCKSVLSDSTYRDLPWSLPNPHGLHRNFDFKSIIVLTSATARVCSESNFYHSIAHSNATGTVNHQWKESASSNKITWANKDKRCLQLTFLSLIILKSLHGLQTQKEFFPHKFQNNNKTTSKSNLWGNICFWLQNKVITAL